MVRLHVFREEARAFTVHRMDLDTQMPYVTRFRFPASDFLYRANTDLAWTDEAALLALDAFAAVAPHAFSVDCAFRRIGAQACLSNLPHYAGLAFDIGRALPIRAQAELREAALASGLFLHTEMPYQSGRGVHVAVSRGSPALIEGAAGPYVFALQDAMQGAGLYRGALTGVYSDETARAVRRLQIGRGTPPTGRADGMAWTGAIALTKAFRNAKM